MVYLVGLLVGHWELMKIFDAESTTWQSNCRGGVEGCEGVFV